MISLITTSYSRDFESCRLLCDSIDRFVTGFDKHYIVVAPDDLAMFSKLGGPHRVIVEASTVLDMPMIELPIRHRGRRYFWGPGLKKPIFGWHLQQLRKIAMTLAQPHERVMHIDSDICFVRPFDASGLATGPVRLYKDPGAIDKHLPDHVKWLNNAYALFGLEGPDLPSDDFVGPLIVWEKASVEAMLKRIETNTGRRWMQAIGRVRDFSEYILYGVSVVTDPVAMARHKTATESPCMVYWDGPALTRATLPSFLDKLGPRQVAVGLQSFIGTPIEAVREVAFRERVA